MRLKLMVHMILIQKKLDQLVILHVLVLSWKNLGAYGDGGCITTNNDKYSKNIRMIKNLGSFNKFDCEVQGVNSRLDTIQAAILT